MSKQWIQATVVVLIVGAITGVGCGQNSASPLVGNLSMASRGHERVYVSGGSQNAPNDPIQGFSLPVSANSVPEVSFGSSARGIAFDRAGRLFVARFGRAIFASIDVYRQPLENSSVPDFTLRLPSLCAKFLNCGWPTDVALDAAGDLFVSAKKEIEECGQRGCNVFDTGVLYVFKSPVTSSSTPRSTIDCAYPCEGVALDSSKRLWVTWLNGELWAFAPPYSNATALFGIVANAQGGIAFDASGSMYVAANDGIDVYRRPFSRSMSKAFTIVVAGAEYLGFDKSGNLYVTTSLSSSALLVFKPPFSGASVPAVTLSTPGVTIGVAIGP
jgi:hypothetical protein